MTKALIAVVPAADRIVANAYLDSLGHGPDTFSVPMIDGEIATPNDDGTYTEEITHYCCHWVGADDVLDGVAVLADAALDNAVMQLTDQIADGQNEVKRATPVTLIIGHKRFATGPVQWGWDAVIRRRQDSGWRVNGKRLQLSSDNTFAAILGEIVFTKETARRWTGELNAMLSGKTAVWYRLVRDNGKVLARGRLRRDDNKAVELPKGTRLTRDEPDESED